MHTTTELFTPPVADYARRLMAAGFTVYGEISPRLRADGAPVPSAHFTYSRTVDGRTCYGQFQNSGPLGMDTGHAMPITPSRLNGSSAHVRDADALDPWSVEAAEAIARPSNWCPWNAEPTEEATRRANVGNGTPKRFYKGATLQNATPWSVTNMRNGAPTYTALEA